MPGFLEFLFGALTNPVQAGMQMALEGVSPEALGTAFNADSQQTLATMMQPQVQMASMTGRPGIDAVQAGIEGVDSPIINDRARTPVIDPNQIPQNPNAPRVPTQRQLQEQYTGIQEGPPQQAQIQQVGGGSNSAQQIQQEFLNSISQGLKNPNAIAAVMATAKHESGFSPNNVFGTWSDPSQSGQAGTAGGILSWRAERLNNLYNFAGTKGQLPDVGTQGRFFLEENPELIRQLEAAQSPQEATMLMNNAWRFAGYDQQGGEAANRIQTASQFAMSGDAFLPGGDIAMASPPPLSGTQPSGDDGRFTTADVMTGGPAAGMPQEQLTRGQKMANKLAQIGKTLKVPEQQQREAPRITGGLGPQVGGTYNPAQMQELFALLGPPPQQSMIPPLSQLIRGTGV